MNHPYRDSARPKGKRWGATRLARMHVRWLQLCASDVTVYCDRAVDWFLLRLARWHILSIEGVKTEIRVRRSVRAFRATHDPNATRQYERIVRSFFRMERNVGRVVADALAAFPPKQPPKPAPPPKKMSD